LYVVSYGCETWSLTSREEHRLRVFEHRVVRKMFGPVREDLTGDWRKLHNEEFHILCCSMDIIWMIRSRMGGACVMYGEKRNAYRVLVGKPAGKRLCGGPMC
jgi:hypothetical protein